MIDSIQIAIGAQSTDNARGGLADERMMAISLPGIGIGQMHFHQRLHQSPRRIENGNRGVAQAGGIQDDAGGILPGIL
jgi:hypothetical protein